MKWTRCAALVLALAACGGVQRSPSDYRPSESAYDVLDSAAPGELALAVQARESGDLATARGLVAALRARHPEHIALALLEQDLEYAATAPDDRGARVIEARARAAEEPTPVHLLLAARLDNEYGGAKPLLERALAIDPRNAWAHYALAHVEARAGRWGEARKSLDRALQLDPGHRSARRLEAALLARNGQRKEAIAALDAWLEVTEGDPLVDASARALALLDLAQLELLEGDAKAALAELRRVGDTRDQAVRKHCLLAAIEQSRDNPEQALAAARKAEGEDAQAALPLVQQALLQEQELDDPEAARRAWERVLEVSSASKDIGALILALRARVSLERTAPVASTP